MRVNTHEQLKNLGYVDFKPDFVNSFPSKHAEILVKGRVKIHLFDKFFEAFYGGDHWVKDKFRTIGTFSGVEIDRLVNERFEGSKG